MAVPAEIRAVPRPVNTIVDDSGRNGPKRYAVRERSYVKYVAGGNPQPSNGRVVGHIINHRFVPVDFSSNRTRGLPDILSYGSSALVHSVVRDIEQDLLAVYDPADTSAIMSAASLKVIRTSVTADTMSVCYSRSFIRRYYPGTVMSHDSYDSLVRRIGMDDLSRRLFFLRRSSAITVDHHIAVEVMRMQDTRTGGHLSDFTYKTAAIDCNDISMIYAYDIELTEPICADFITGHVTDSATVSDFIHDYDLQRGILFTRIPSFGGIGEPEPLKSSGLLKLVFDRYKQDKLIDLSNDPGSFALIGSGFISFISALATCRIINLASQAGLLDKMSYGDLMDHLNSALRIADAPEDPFSDDGYWVYTPSTVLSELEALKLSKPSRRPGSKKLKHRKQAAQQPPVKSN